jgi:hypothetical protein
VYGNVLVDNTNGINLSSASNYYPDSRDPDGCSAAPCSGYGHYVFNNTIYKFERGGLSWDRSPADTHTIYNNLIVNDLDGSISANAMKTSSSLDQWEPSRPDCLAPGSLDNTLYYKTSYHKVENCPNALGTFTPTENDVNSDPKFKDRTNNDFSIGLDASPSTSPAKNAGTKVDNNHAVMLGPTTNWESFKSGLPKLPIKSFPLTSLEFLGPVPVTKTQDQGTNWGIGAYVSRKSP